MICTECFQDVQAKPSISFLGFPWFACPRCNKAVHYPLSTVRLVVYWIIVAVVIGFSINALANNAIPIPGILGVATIIAIVMDFGYRSKLKEAQRRHAAQQPPPASPPAP